MNLQWKCSELNLRIYQVLDNNNTQFSRALLWRSKIVPFSFWLICRQRFSSNLWQFFYFLVGFDMIQLIWDSFLGVSSPIQTWETSARDICSINEVKNQSKDIDKHKKANFLLKLFFCPPLTHPPPTCLFLFIYFFLLNLTFHLQLLVRSPVIDDSYWRKYSYYILQWPLVKCTCAWPSACFPKFKEGMLIYIFHPLEDYISFT